MNFINNGTDDLIVKSLEGQLGSENISKALNREGLVQQDIQVRGKNGKVYTGKQWVRASEKSGSTKQSSQSLHNEVSNLKNQIENDNLEDCYVDPDGIRIGDDFYWKDTTKAGGYFKGSWEKASTGDEDFESENHPCSVKDVQKEYEKHKNKK